MSLGARLKSLRLKNEQSLQQVADAVKVSKAHIWELEVGRSRNPSMELLKNIADHYKTTVAALLGEDTSSSEEELELQAMFRDLKSLGQKDRELIAGVIESIRRNRDDDRKEDKQN